MNLKIVEKGILKSEELSKKVLTENEIGTIFGGGCAPNDCNCQGGGNACGGQCTGACIVKISVSEIPLESYKFIKI